MDPMRSGKELSFEDLRKIVAPIATEHGIIRAYLFGSRARGDNDKGSDFDFCIVIPEEYDLFDIGSFYHDLREAVGSDIDLVWEDNAVKNPSLMEEIMRDRKIIFDAQH